MHGRSRERVSQAFNPATTAVGPALTAIRARIYVRVAILFPFFLPENELKYIYTREIKASKVNGKIKQVHNL